MRKGSLCILFFGGVPDSYVIEILLKIVDIFSFNVPSYCNSAACDWMSLKKTGKTLRSRYNLRSLKSEVVHYLHTVDASHSLTV